MSQEVIIALISSIVGGILVAITNHILVRRKMNVEIEKIAAEKKKIQTETERIKEDLEFEQLQRRLKTNSYEPLGWNLAGEDVTSYRVGIDRENSRDGSQCGFIMSIKTPYSTGTLMQKIVGEKFYGKRVRLSAYIMTENVKDWAALWFRADIYPKYAVAFDNMENRPISGSTKWTKYENVLDIPINCTKITYGLLLCGEGKAWIDNVQLEIVDDTIPVTGLVENDLEIGVSQEPRNLDFNDS